MPDNFKIIETVVKRNRLTKPTNVTRYTSGIVHDTYDLGEYVLKVEGVADHAKGVLEYQPGIIDRLLSIGAKVPRIFDSGAIDGKQYLLMAKVRGTNLVNNWLKFDKKRKERLVAELAEELRKYHSIQSTQHMIPICFGVGFPTQAAALQRLIRLGHIRTEDLSDEQKDDIEYLYKFYEENIGILSNEEAAVFIHNDIHLENIFYEDDHITGIIDFDWAAYAPKDYELRQIIETVRCPKWTVQGDLEPLYENYQMTEEFGFLKKYYPELFQQDKLVTRVRLFYLRKVLDRIIQLQKGMWKKKEKVWQIFSEEVRDIYKTDWLEKLLA